MVPKPNGDIRLIHDLSHPPNNSLNDLASKDECHYVTIDQALSHCTPGSYLSTLDLQWAYRSIPIKPNERTLTGLAWKFIKDTETTYLADCRLPFGARKSPAIFNRITQAIQRMMLRRGYQVSCYLDDFLIHAPTKETCLTALNSLVALLRKLGLRINWKKLCDPCQCLTFLGVQINTVQGTLRLDPTKASALRLYLQDIGSKSRLSRKQLQSLGGKLNWAANVHPWGRAFMDSTYNAISLLNGPTHKFRLTKAFASDIAWWLERLNNDHHVRKLWDTRPNIHMHTDSSIVGGGAFCQGDWIYTNWMLDKPRLSALHINFKELAMTVEAAARWAPHYAGHNLEIYTDNMMTFYALNNKRSTSPWAAYLLKQMANIATTYSVTIQGYYVKGSHNDLADCISRLHAPGQTTRFMSLLTAASTTCPAPAFYYLPCHMSSKSLAFLFKPFQKARDLWINWTKRLHCYDPTHWQPVQSEHTPPTSRPI